MEEDEISTTQRINAKKTTLSRIKDLKSKSLEFGTNKELRTESLIKNFDQLRFLN